MQASTVMYVSIRGPVGSTDQANPSCFYFRISWILMEWPWFYLFLSPPLVAGPQKPQKLTASKPKYENFGPKIPIPHEKIGIYNFKTSWPQKISIYKFLFDTIVTLILMINKMPLIPSLNSKIIMDWNKWRGQKK